MTIMMMESCDEAHGQPTTGTFEARLNGATPGCLSTTRITRVFFLLTSRQEVRTIQPSTYVQRCDRVLPTRYKDQQQL
jgi:hypothetical protein